MCSCIPIYHDGIRKDKERISNMNFPTIDKYIQSDDTPIAANKSNQPTASIPALMAEYGGGNMAALKMHRPVLHIMAGCYLEIQKSVSSIKKNPKTGKTIISDKELSSLENYIKSLGIDDIGYTVVDNSMIFRDCKILYDKAIVITMEMKKDAIGTAPSKPAIKEIFRTYYGLGKAVNKISTYLRKMGFNAMAGPAAGGDVSYVPLAQKAGLGCIGNHGLLISSKGFGPSLRIAAVYTDIENLPLSKSNPHMWINDFCDKCVRSCPSGAIYSQPITVNGDINKLQYIDNTKCAVPFTNDYGCTVCVKSCTFFNGDYEKIKAGFTKR